jgi:outer membrane lipoprotein-sorting protein
MLLLVPVGPVSGQAFPSVADLLVRLDAQQTFTTDLSCRVTLTQTSRKQGDKIFQSFFYRSDAVDSFLIVVTGPEAEKGNGYLRVGENFWLYRRNTRTFSIISRDESISGTDARGGDFERRKLSELYRPVVKNGREQIREEKLGVIPVYRIEIEAKVADVTYPRQVYWIRRDNLLPLKTESYALSGTLMQTSYFRRYEQIAGKFFLTEGLFIDEFEKGNRTLLSISGISLAAIDRRVFTKPYLENLSK